MDNLEKIEIYKKGIASQFVDDEFKEQMRSKIAELEGATAPQTTQEDIKDAIELLQDLPETEDIKEAIELLQDLIEEPKFAKGGKI